MSTESNWLRQLGKAMEFANQVGSPTALPDLLAKQAIAAMNAKGQLALIEKNSKTTGATETNGAAKIPHLACAR